MCKFSHLDLPADPQVTCELQDLDFGDRFYDPRTRKMLMVIAVPASYNLSAGYILAVGLADGVVEPWEQEVRLADRGDGVLYASRRLNEGATVAAQAPAILPDITVA